MNTEMKSDNDLFLEAISKYEIGFADIYDLYIEIDVFERTRKIVNNSTLDKFVSYFVKHKRISEELSWFTLDEIYLYTINKYVLPKCNAVLAEMFIADIKKGGDSLTTDTNRMRRELMTREIEKGMK